MPRRLLAALLFCVAAPASAQVPAGTSRPGGTTPAPSAAPAPSAGAAPAPNTAAPSAAPAVGVPTYWVLMVTGEKDGVPWIKTYTPETLGGAVKGTGPWSCAYPPTERGVEEGIGYEQNEIACGVGDAEVFVSLRCNFRTKAKPGKVPGKGWKRSDLQTLNLRKKGDIKSTITVSLRCDVDAAFATEG